MRIFRTGGSLALSLAAVAAFAAPAHADVKAGVDAWQSGDYKAAVSEWRPLAIAGDADAQFNLGQAYKLGRGVPADLVQAEGWYRRAAKQGHLQAEDNLGLILFTANRRDEAMPFILRSAERGEPRAQYVLGTAHFNGDLAREDWPRAYALTKRASDAGLTLASARLVQLDQLIPLDQRQQGLAMLPEIEKAEQRARLAAVGAAAPPVTKAAAPSPIKVASVPPSVPGTSYTPPPVVAATAPTPAAIRATEAATAATAAATAAKAVTPTSTMPGTSYAAPPESGTTPPAQAKPVLPPQPKAVIAKTAPAPNAAASPWRAQLGAFGVEGNARNLWASLEKKNSAFAGRQPYLVKSGKITRLQAGGFASKGEAESFCAAVRKGGQDCLVVDK